MQIIPTDGIIATSPTVIPMDDIEDAVVLDDIDPDNHPNFIESNTSAVTFEELTEKSICEEYGIITETAICESDTGQPTQ